MTEQDVSQAAVPAVPPRRRHVRQTDVPRVAFEQALRIPQAIAEQLGMRASHPLTVAKALGMSPGSSRFREVSGAAIGYGLTIGGPNAERIDLTDLGRRIVGPTREGDDQTAKREAVLTPTVVSKFLRDYDGKPLPREEIARNVLMQEYGVPHEASARVYEVIRANAESVNFITKIKDREYVDLGASRHGDSDADTEGLLAVPTAAEKEEPASRDGSVEEPASTAAGSQSAPPNRVFVSAVGAPDVEEQILTLMRFGGWDAVGGAENQASESAQWKSLDDDIVAMRTCVAGVLFIASPEDEGTPPLVAVLRVPAARALFGDRLVILTAENVDLPAELQGINVIRYGAGGLTLPDMTRVAASLNHEPDES